MSAREEKALKLFSNGNNYNCAQAVVGAFCEENGLDKNIAFKLANGFGGGIRCGDTCGAVSGAVMAIGLKCGFYAEKDFEQKRFCYTKTDEFLETFRKENGSTLCRDLLGADIRSPEDFKKPEIRELFKTLCPKMVASAVRIVEKIVFEL
jgi:C_GCAxxG_C_C family probable redox protein